ncbi:MAG TPA: response regulator transcription factor [Pseudolabrys sp.]|nr:response regulator transcription factor [Pseudolabrys sp.]
MSTFSRSPFGTVLVGCNALIREGLARILSSADFPILASVPTFSDLPNSWLTHERSILLIVDVSDDFAAVIAKAAAFKRACPAARLAILARRMEVGEVVTAFQVGADAYFVEITKSEAFIKSMELVMLGQTVLSAGLLPRVLEQIEPLDSELRLNRQINWRLQDAAATETAHGAINDVVKVASGKEVTTEPELAGSNGAQLSPRQKSILYHLIKGDSNKTIARKMRLAEATVKVHVKTILRKIQVRNRTQAAIWGMKRSNELTNSLVPAKLSIEQSGNLNSIEHEDRRPSKTGEAARR